MTIITQPTSTDQIENLQFQTAQSTITMQFNVKSGVGAKIETDLRKKSDGTVLDQTETVFSLSFEKTFNNLQIGECYLFQVRIFSLGCNPEVDVYDFEQGTEVSAPTQTPLSNTFHFSIGNNLGLRISTQEHLYFFWYHSGGLEHFSIQVEPLGLSYDIDPSSGPDGWEKHTISPGEQYTVTVRAYSCGAFSDTLVLTQTAKPYPPANFQLNSIEPGEDFIEVTWSLSGFGVDRIEIRFQPTHLSSSGLQTFNIYDTLNVFYKKIDYTFGRAFRVKAVAHSNGNSAESNELSGSLYVQTPTILSSVIYSHSYVILWSGVGYYGSAAMTVNYTSRSDVTTHCAINQENMNFFGCSITDSAAHPLHHSTYYQVSTVFTSNGRSTPPIVFVDRTRPNKQIGMDSPISGIHDVLLHLDTRGAAPFWDHIVCRAHELSFAGCTPAPDPLGLVAEPICIIEPTVDTEWSQEYEIHVVGIPNPSGGGYGFRADEICAGRKFGLDTQPWFTFWMRVSAFHAANYSALCVTSITANQIVHLQMYLYHPDVPDVHCDYPVLNRLMGGNEEYCVHQDDCSHLLDDHHCRSYKICNRQPYEMRIENLGPEDTWVEMYRTSFFEHIDYRYKVFAKLEASDDPDKRSYTIRAQN
ncbi:uncharacterized protein LOC142344345 [Convolutriloba macropyga]|uniref:uncharacterized protein LOC142344345 n=1 Tax=Convolutriloba macropyga TaxID=536237 RepID=UPI003F521055